MAGLSFPVVYTVAVEVIKQIDTLASILTGVPAALVYVWKRVRQQLSALVLATDYRPNVIR